MARWAAAILFLQAQDDPVGKAVAEFQRAFAGTESDKIGALDHLRDLAHDKVFAEFARALADAPAVRAKAIHLLSAIDHPKSAELLSAAVKNNMADKVTQDALINALDRLAWDSFLAAVADAFADKVLDPNLTGQAFLVITAAERIGSVALIEPLIKALKTVDEKLNEGGARLTGSAEQYLAQLRKSLVACTGQDLPSAAAYETWWKKNKAAVLKKAREVLWCRTTGKRWDRTAGDTKTFCPHHEDQQQASRDSSVVAMRTLR